MVAKVRRRASNGKQSTANAKGDEGSADEPNATTPQDGATSGTIPDIDMRPLFGSEAGREMLRGWAAFAVWTPSDLREVIWRTANAAFRLDKQRGPARAEAKTIEIILRGLHAALEAGDREAIDDMKQTALRVLRARDTDETPEPVIRELVDKGQLGRLLVEWAEVFRGWRNFGGIMATMVASVGRFSDMPLDELSEKLHREFKHDPATRRSDPEALAVRVLRALDIPAKTARTWVCGAADKRAERAARRGESVK